ncbi:MAG: TolB family protein [Bdellovibrionales bacterium]
MPLLIVIGCKHPNPAPAVVAQGVTSPGPIAENKSGTLQYIVEDGESSQAVYNSKGDKLLFVSKKRPGHTQDQVYEKDLVSGVERRVTFQNGSTFQPHYHAKEPWIVYSSSTDELKENPPLLRPNSQIGKLPYPYQEPMEVYTHSLRGFEIQRLTDHQGFDGEARFGADSNSITFTRVSGQKTEIINFHRTLHTAHNIKDLGANPTNYISTTDGKSHAWVEWDDSYGVTRLRVKKGKDEPVELNSDMIVTKADLSFTPDNNWILWTQKDASNPVYDLWIADMATLCPRRLTTSTEGERRYPVLSPDLKWLTFTMVDAKRSRIARIGFVPPTGPCPTAP